MSVRHSSAWALRVCRLAIPIAVIACAKADRQPAAEPASLDTRTAVPLPAEGHEAVLREMRDLLAAMGGAMAAAAKGDTAAVLAAIAPGGSAAAADPALEALLPAAWKELAERIHGGFDSLAVAVRQTRNAAALKDTVLVRLSTLSGQCTACHASFRATIR